MSSLCSYDVCNLGSINLGVFVKDGSLDWAALARAVHLSHFLENVIDANSYPLGAITDLAQRIRRIRLGVMGLADVFVALGIPYDSEAAVELGRKIQRFVDTEAKVESERLAGVRGRSRNGKRASGDRMPPAPGSGGQPDPPDAAAPQLQRHHRGAHRHHLDHRRLQLRDRAALRRGVHAEPGRRADARRERRLPPDREGGGGTPRS